MNTDTLQYKNSTQSNRWFVFSDDQQRGPLTWEAIEIELESGIITEEALLWTSGMQKWQSYQQIKAGLATIPTPSRPEKSKLFEAPKPRKLVSHQIISETKKTPKKISFPTEKVLPFVKKNARILSVLGTGILLFAIFFNPHARLMNEISSALPKDEVPVIKSFLKTPQILGGSSTIVSITAGNARTPSFYVFSNLKDGSEIEVQLTGVPGSLLNRIHYEQTQKVILDGRWAKTNTFNINGKTPLARGIYTVSVVNPATHETLSKRSYFIGAPNDEAFAKELKVYNQKLASIAARERGELKEYLSTLENQLVETNSHFHDFVAQKKQNPNHALQKWRARNAEWNMFQTQLSNIFNAWTPEQIQNNLYYFQLFADLKNLEMDVRKLHAQQVEQKNIDQVFDAESAVQGKLLELRSRIQRITSTR